MLLMANTSFAATAKLSMTSKIKSSTNVYQASGDEDGTLTQTSSRSVQETKMKGTGILSSINTKESEVDTKVVGIDYKGYSKISIVQKDGGVYVHIEQKIDDYIVEDGISVKLNIRSDYYAEAQFTKGSFNAFQNGDDIELQLTEVGQEAANKQAAGKLKYSMILIKNALKKELPEIGDVVLEEVKSKGNAVFKGNKSKIQVSGVSLKLKLSLSVRY